MSAQAIAVLEALRAGHTYGRSIMAATGLKSGSVYPILARMEAAGMLVSHYEEVGPVGRPRRRVYEIIDQDTAAPTG